MTLCLRQCDLLARRICRGLGHICCRIGLIGFVIIFTSIVVISISFTSSNFSSPTRVIVNGIEVESESSVQIIHLSNRKVIHASAAQSSALNQQTTDRTGNIQRPTTSLAQQAPIKSTTVEISEITNPRLGVHVVNFRLINYFDTPAVFPNPPEDVKTSGGLTLPVKRYGNFLATLRSREMAILIPTIYRPKETYLFKTIKNLLENMSEEEKERIVILVSINEIFSNSTSLIQSTAEGLIKEFPKEVQDGLIEVVSAPPQFYMDFAKVPDIQDPAIVDIPARLHWRSKQVIDYAFMFSYAFTQRMAKFVLLLEDDVIVTERDFITTMLDYPDRIGADENHAPPLILWYEFCPWGAIGKMFPIKQIPTFVNIMTTIFYVEPVDWQLGHIAEIFACRYFHSKEQCDRLRKQYFRVFPRRLFKHIAKVSTAPEQPARNIPAAS